MYGLRPGRILGISLLPVLLSIGGCEPEPMDPATGDPQDPEDVAGIEWPNLMIVEGPMWASLSESGPEQSNWVFRLHLDVKLADSAQLGRLRTHFADGEVQAIRDLLRGEAPTTAARNFIAAVPFTELPDTLFAPRHQLIVDRGRDTSYWYRMDADLPVMTATKDSLLQLIVAGEAGALKTKLLEITGLTDRRTDSRARMIDAISIRPDSLP